MMKRARIFFLFVGLGLVVGCTSTRKIQKNMNSNSYSMAYLMDSRISDVKKDIGVSIDTVYFNSNILSDTTKVIRQKGWCVPLLVVNFWKSQNRCIQGKSMFEEDIPEFFKQSVVEEVSRSGNFKIDSSSQSEYEIELSIDELKTEGPYQSSGFFYFALYAYGYAYSDNAGPAISNLSVSYKLKKNGQVVLANSFRAEKATEQITKRYTNIKILQEDYAISMVEATSYNIKSVIEMIVRNVNQYLDASSADRKL